MSELTDELMDYFAHDLSCSLPIRRGVSFVHMAREIIRLRARISELERKSIPDDVISDMMDLVKLLTELSVTHKFPYGTETKLDNVYATLVEIKPEETE